MGQPERFKFGNHEFENEDCFVIKFHYKFAVYCTEIGLRHKAQMTH